MVNNFSSTQIYSQGSAVPSIAVHYVGYVVASMQGNSKNSVGISLTVVFNGRVEAPCKATVRQ
jgi:hypothetical protein